MVKFRCQFRTLVRHVHPASPALADGRTLAAVSSRSAPKPASPGARESSCRQVFARAALGHAGFRSVAANVSAARRRSPAVTLTIGMTRACRGPRQSAVHSALAINPQSAVDSQSTDRSAIRNPQSAMWYPSSPMYSRDEVKAITDKVMNMAKADAVEVDFTGGERSATTVRQLEHHRQHGPVRSARSASPSTRVAGRPPHRPASSTMRR